MVIISLFQLLKVLNDSASSEQVLLFLHVLPHYFILMTSSLIGIPGDVISIVINKCDVIGRFSDLWHLFFVAISNKLSWSKRSSSGIPHDSNNVSGWVRDVLKLLVSSRHGLSRDELLEMLTLIGYSGKRSVTSFDWQLFEVSGKVVMTSLMNR